MSASEEESHELIDPDLDTEVCSHATTLSVPPSNLESHCFERFSSWKSLVRAITSLTHIVQSQRSATKAKNDICSGWHQCKKPHTAEELSKAETLIVRCVQREAYSKELPCLAAGKDIPKDSPLRKLNPCVDEEGLLRIGGRLSHAALDAREKFPFIIPGRTSQHCS